LALRLPLCRLDVLTGWFFLEAGTADELPAGFLAVVADQRPAALRALLARLLAALGRHLRLGLAQCLRERAPELGEHLVVLALPPLDLVKFLLKVAGELQVHDAREVLHQQVGDDLADLGGVEAAFLHLDVAALLRRDLVDDRGVSAWPADALLLQRLY